MWCVLCAVCCVLYGSEFRVQGVGCRVQGVGCRVQGAGCRVQGAGCGVYERGGVVARDRGEHAPAIQPTSRAWFMDSEFISQNGVINWFEKVNSPRESSTYCLLLLLFAITNQNIKLTLFGGC